MRGYWFLGGLVLACCALLGCKGPGQVCANVFSSLDMPLKDPEPLLQTNVDRAACGNVKVALIDVDGLLLNMNMTGALSAGENPVEMFREKLDLVARDPGFRALVVRINSPGGGVAATDVMWRDLRSFKERTGLPVVACLMDVATSGAYYVATAADEIYAHPTTITGGIGVILNGYNLTNLATGELGTYRPIKSGKYVDLGTPMRELDDVSQDVLLATAKKFHLQFQEVVRQSRPLRVSDKLPPSDKPTDRSSDGQKPVSVRDYDYDYDSESAPKPLVYEEFPAWCDGRIFTADQAAEIGLIDHVGYLADAINSAKQQAGCPQAKVVVLHRAKDPAHSEYSITPNGKSALNMLNLSVPGIERSRLPTFMYIWLVEPTLDSSVGR